MIYSDATNGTKTYSFTYDGYGRRIGKSYTFTVGSTVPTSYIASAITNYTYDTKGKLIKENYTATSNTSSTTTKEIMYLYDESSIVGIIYTVNGTSATYYLDKNIKGDVLRIYGSTGNVVAEYGYDAYGNCTILSSTNADLANFNPIRYRGYYYDTETGLYFLNSRYYNPAWRRFISPSRSNALNPEAINGLNSYVYAGNNPVKIINNWSTNSVNSKYKNTSYDSASRKSVASVNAKSSDRVLAFNIPHIEMVNNTNKVIDNKLISWFVGNFSHKTTIQLSPSETFYTYSNIGNGGNSIGFGIDFGRWYGVTMHISDNIGIGSDVRLGSNFTWGAEVSLMDGVTINVGQIEGNITEEYSISIGWGIVFAHCFEAILYAMLLRAKETIWSTGEVTF